MTLQTNEQMLLWNFSINGAVNDCFSFINPTNPKLNNKLLQIDNAQNFNNYRYFLCILTSFLKTKNEKKV